MRKLKLNERNVVIDSFERLVHYSETDYSLWNSERGMAADSGFALVTFRAIEIPSSYSN